MFHLARRLLALLLTVAALAGSPAARAAEGDDAPNPQATPAVEPVQTSELSTYLPLVVVPTPPPNPFGPWSGVTSAGQPVAFNRAAGAVNSFALTTRFAGCGASGTTRLTILTPQEVRDGRFAYNRGDYAFDGQFLSDGEARGTFRFSNYPVNISLPFPPFFCVAYVNAQGTWSAAPGAAKSLEVADVELAVDTPPIP